MRLANSLLCLALGASPLAAQEAGLTITYLGNMGVLAEGGGRRVVIDGFHRGELEPYAAVPPRLLGALEYARPPFERLDLAFTTHRHRDHFNAQSVAARLVRDSAMPYVAARETVESLVARSSLPPRHPRLHPVLPPPGGAAALTVGSLTIEVLDLPHNPTPSTRVANVGLLVELAGFRLLHVGDAHPTAENFLPHHLDERGVDVAIVPFWYLTDEGDAVRRAIGARTWIATHIPPADSAQVRARVMRTVPAAIVLVRPGERFVVR
jgi:L-ascorbate metabolism protein UlaG (beta-lactamase superfamily)